MKRSIIALLILGILSGALVSCANTGDQTDNSSGQVALPSGEASGEPGDVYDVPDVKYDGHELQILSAGNVAYDDFSFSESSEVVLDNAQYLRKATVEQKFDVTIKFSKKENKSSFGEGPGFQEISRAVGAEDCVYEVCLIGTYDATNLAVTNNLYDLASLDYVNLNNSWWDQNANEDLSINGLMFFTTGDLSVGNNNATFTLVFNKTLAAETEIEDPYELVKNDKWTYEKLYGMVKKVSLDVDGNQEMNMRDKFGMIIWDDSVMAVVNSVGSRVCTVGEDGNVSLTFNNERTIGAFNAWIEMVLDKETSICNQRFGSANGTVGEMWEQGRALFRNCLINTVHSMRLMEADFGILPYPKLTEDQERYYSTLAPYNGQFICVPLVLEDEERTGIITESLAYYGSTIVRPAFYDKTLYGQNFRDEQSGEMLDVILSSYIYDFGWYYQIGGYNERLMDLVRAYSSEFASMFAAGEVQANTKLSTINDSYKSVVDEWK